jgi:hypothetical protein
MTAFSANPVMNRTLRFGLMPRAASAAYLPINPLGKPTMARYAAGIGHCGEHYPSGIAKVKRVSGGVDGTVRVPPCARAI